jgi:hypothetical protein
VGRGLADDVLYSGTDIKEAQIGIELAHKNLGKAFQENLILPATFADSLFRTLSGKCLDYGRCQGFESLLIFSSIPSATIPNAENPYHFSTLDQWNTDKRG